MADWGAVHERAPEKAKVKWPENAISLRCVASAVPHKADEPLAVGPCATRELQSLQTETNTSAMGLSWALLLCCWDTSEPYIQTCAAALLCV